MRLSLIPSSLSAPGWVSWGSPLPPHCQTLTQTLQAQSGRLHPAPSPSPSCPGVGVTAPYSPPCLMVPFHAFPLWQFSPDTGVHSVVGAPGASNHLSSSTLAAGCLPQDCSLSHGGGHGSYKSLRIGLFLFFCACLCLCSDPGSLEWGRALETKEVALLGGKEHWLGLQKILLPALPAAWAVCPWTSHFTSLGLCFPQDCWELARSLQPLVSLASGGISREENTDPLGLPKREHKTS